jgi:hypothetical protein
MYDDIIYIVVLILEVAVFIFFTVYIFRYFKTYHETIDPYTKLSLMLLSVSFIFQFMRLPIKVLELIDEYSEPGDRYFQWYLNNEPTLNQIVNIIVFCHGNTQKSAILINIFRWQILIITLDNTVQEKAASLIKKVKVALIGVFILMVFSSAVLLYKPFKSVDLYLQFALGSFLNGYAINFTIVFYYIVTYLRLKQLYKNIQFKY